MRLDAARIRDPVGLHAILTDFRTDMAAIVTAFATLSAKLDADGDVGTTTYNANDPTLITLAGDNKHPLY